MKKLLILAAITSAFGDPVEWKISDGGNGHSYELVGSFNVVTQRWTFEQSRRMAWLRGGHLVTITSPEENQFIISHVLGTNDLPTWIGLTDDKAYGGHESHGLANPQTNGWVWITGELVNFTFWNTGSPDQTRVNENFAGLGSFSVHTFRWNDWQGNDTEQFIVEYDNLTARLQNKKPQIVWPTLSTNGCVLEWSENLKDWKTEAIFQPAEILTIHTLTNLPPARFYRLLLLP